MSAHAGVCACCVAEEAFANDGYVTPGRRSLPPMRALLSSLACAGAAEGGHGAGRGEDALKEEMLAVVVASSKFSVEGKKVSLT